MGLPDALWYQAVEYLDIIMVSKCMLCCGRERQSSSCPGDRGRSEEVKAVRSGLR